MGAWRGAVDISETGAESSRPDRRPGLTPLTRGLAAFAIANFAIVTLTLIVLAGTSWRETVLHPVSWFFQGRQGSDSWRPMGEAYDYTQSGERKKSLYTAMFFSPRVRHKGLQYPPSSLLVIHGLRALCGRFSYTALEWITWASVPLMAYFVGLVFGHGREGGTRRRDEVACWLIVAGLTLTFYPAIRAYRNGQVQAWINTLFAASLWFWLKDRKGVAGVLVGVCALFKPQWWLLMLWGALRREWRFLGGTALTALIGLALSVAVFGLAPNLEYLGVLRFIARRGESFYPNQSFNGLLNRLFGNGESVAWMETFPRPHPWVYAGTLVSSAILVALALFGPGWRRGKRSGADFSLIALTATMASPIAWEHHYGVLLPIFAFLLPQLLRTPVLGSWSLPALALAYVLASNSFMVTNRWADTALGVLQSYLLFAALIVFILLLLVRRAGPNERG